MLAVKKQVRRLQVALAVGVSAATFIMCGCAMDAANLPLSCASAVCGLLSGACWLMCE